MEKLELKDFDLLGIIELQDIAGIESLVTPIIFNNKIISYLSRSKEYYNVKSMGELSKIRENLKELLTEVPSKRNFVILEYMLNCSAKVYFKKFEEYIKSAKDEKLKIELEQAKKCLEEDTVNMVAVLSSKKVDKEIETHTLPEGEENCERRFIEMDNKAMLYLFSKSIHELKLGKNFEVLTPGYGSIYIGPFVKVMCGYDYSSMMKSKYIDETNRLNGYNIANLISSDRIFHSDIGVLLLDDNIGTGITMVDVKKKLHDAGKDAVMSGAVQYNWRNYYRVSTGEKADIDRFEANEYDFLTPLNYAGHKLYEHAVDALNAGGIEYIKYLNSKGYRLNDRYNDIVGNLLRGITWAGKTRLNLIELNKSQNSEKEQIEILPRYRSGPLRIDNQNARKMIQLMYEYSRELLDKDIDNKEYIDRE